jgi:hypothetical protein
VAAVTVTVTVTTPAKIITVPGGVDFVIDWENGAEPGPGLAVLDKDESDNTAKYLAYFPPGCWVAVVKTTD